MKITFLLPLLLISILSCSDKSNKDSSPSLDNLNKNILNKPLASKLIKECLAKYPKTETMMISLGNKVVLEDEAIPLYQELADKQYLNMKKNIETKGQSTYEISLSNKGKEFIEKSFISESCIVIDSLELNNTESISIEEIPQANRAHVVYELQKKPTPFAILKPLEKFAVRKADRAKKTTGSHNQFVKKDNGWEIICNN